MIEDEKVITLRKPITLGKDGAIVYDKLALREPTADEYTKACKAGDKNDVLLALIHEVTELPRSVVGKIGLREMQECGNFFGQFLIEIPPPSPTSSPN